ncbi:MAG: 50S ribosomal protein L13 [Planctomycetota bacterium]
MSIGYTRTWVAKTGEFSNRWLLVDATGKPLGRLAASLAMILQGKHRPTWTAHVDTGDFVVVVNAEKVLLTGTNKREQMTYTKYTGYWSGHKEMTVEVMLKKHPERLIEYAVKRMLPKTKLARSMLRKMKVYRGAEHPHEAQKPEAYKIPIKGAK